MLDLLFLLCYIIAVVKRFRLTWSVFAELKEGLYEDHRDRQHGI